MFDLHWPPIAGAENSDLSKAEEEWLDNSKYRPKSPLSIPNLYIQTSPTQYLSSLHYVSRMCVVTLELRNICICHSCKSVTWLYKLCLTICTAIAHIKLVNETVDTFSNASCAEGAGDPCIHLPISFKSVYLQSVWHMGVAWEGLVARALKRKIFITLGKGNLYSFIHHWAYTQIVHNNTTNVDVPVM